MYLHVDQQKLGTRRAVPPGPLLSRSSLSTLDCGMRFRGFGVKYVLSGVERYTVNGREFAVQAGRYLLVNSSCTGSVLIDSARAVEGLCVELPDTLLNEVASALCDPNSLDGPRRVSSFAVGWEPRMEEGSLTRVGLLMRTLLQDPLNHSHDPRTLSNTFYHRIAEAAVLDQLTHADALGKVSAVQPSTRTEILRRIERARSMVHDRFSEALTIEDLSLEASMSPYHFSRAFRSIHGRSPYQYLQALRVDHAKDLLTTTDVSLSEVAEMCGLGDIHTFSKSFKRMVGIAPSTFRGSNGRAL